VPILEIHDPDDPRVADFRDLNDAAGRRRIETAGPFNSGFFVAEGWLVIERVLQLRRPIRSVLVADGRLDRLVELLGGHATDTTVMAAEPATISAIVGFDLHRGVVATVERPRVPDPHTLARRSRRLLVIEGVNDAENLGVLFRNAAGLGCDGAAIDPSVGDPLTRRTVRVSMGHVVGVPWTRSPEPWALADHRRLALSPSPDATPLEQITVGPDDRIALLVGAEGPGLSPAALAAADQLVSIPMAQGVDSLNVASAAAIAMWRLFSRSAGTSG
jgi:tRNA G18 (ribose-2'-O)-methylase SpoU